MRRAADPGPIESPTITGILRIAPTPPAEPTEWVDLGCGLGPVPRRRGPRRPVWTDPDRLLAAAAAVAVGLAILQR